MPDISTKTTLGTLVGDEWLYCIATPSGTPADRKFTPATLLAYLLAQAGFTEAVQDTVGGMVAAAGGGYNDGAGIITLPGGGGSGSGTWALPAAAANPASPYAPADLTGNTVVRITGITGAKTLNPPAGTFPAGRNWVLYQIGATGGPFAITMGAGITHDGIGAAPSFAVPANGLLNILIYTDDAGSTWRYSGDYDFAANKAAVLAALGISTLKARFQILDPADGTHTLLDENFNIGTVLGALCYTDQGSATLNLRIADKTGASDYTPTGAASITGLGAVAVTTTKTRTAASGAAAMARSGNADRILQAVLTSTTGTPNILTIEVEYAL